MGCQKLLGEPIMLDVSNRAPAVQSIYKFFKWDHLPGKLQIISEPCCRLADQMINAVEDSAELTAGLRKLLEAKDCFVRAALPPTD